MQYDGAIKLSETKETKNKRTLLEIYLTSVFVVWTVRAYHVVRHRDVCVTINLFAFLLV